MKKFFLIIFILVVASCKLFETKDNTDPIVNITIAGGNEISREVTLYLDIEDDSKIESVSIMIDDTTAYTVESNFDTIRFDVTPFADESEHILYAIVEDSEGNIGESEKLDVVITEFPGWRIYHDIEVNHWDITTDPNGRLWSCNFYEIGIFDPSQKTFRLLNSDNSPLNWEFIQRIKVIEDSRVWILTDNRLLEYHYDLDKWTKEIELPPTDNWYNGLAIDKDFNVWIGSYWGNRDSILLKYDHVNFTPYKYSNVGSISDIEIHPDGTLFVSGEPGVDYLKEGKIYSFDDYPYPLGDGIPVVIDSNRNVWSTAISSLGGCAVYDGNSWENILVNNSNRFLHPTLTASNGTIYFFSDYSIITNSDNNWLVWDNIDCPFNSTLENALKIWGNGITEAPNGDIWMVAEGSILLRYRPSLGGIHKL